MPRKLAALTVLALASVNLTFAKDKFKDSDYRPATLVSFRTQSVGASCSGNVNAEVEDNGQVNGTTNSNCSDQMVRFYTIQVEGQTFTVIPAHTGKQKAVGFATLGWSNAFSKGSVLINQLPGAHIEVRSDPSGLFIRVGKKESKFTIVEAADSKPSAGSPNPAAPK